MAECTIVITADLTAPIEDEGFMASLGCSIRDLVDAYNKRCPTRRALYVATDENGEVILDENGQPITDEWSAEDENGVPYPPAIQSYTITSAKWS